MKATKVAQRRDSGRRSTTETLALSAKRASTAIRLGGIDTVFGIVMPRSRTSRNRSRARTSDGPLTLTGPLRNFSSTE